MHVTRRHLSVYKSKRMKSDKNDGKENGMGDGKRDVDGDGVRD